MGTKGSKTSHECNRHVYHSGLLGSFNCSRPGTKKHKGSWYCWQHYPPTVKAREARAQAKWDAKFDELTVDMQRRRETMNAMEGVGIVDEELQQGAVKALYDAANWVLHVESGIGKSGGPPDALEYEEALDSLKVALERFETKAKGES